MSVSTIILAICVILIAKIIWFVICLIELGIFFLIEHIEDAFKNKKGK